ncbi:MAG TPA: hypothetical protein VFN67_33005 [Polyangiales bacterium]|nr:hypothetical protein [Polyangiales bacterium]
MRDKRTRGPGSKGPNDSRSPNDWLDDRLQPWATGAANDNARSEEGFDFADEATTLYQKPARRPSARYRPPIAAKDEPRFGVEGSLPRSLRPGQSERGRSYSALLAGVLVIGLGAIWTMRGPAWSRAMLSISAYGASVATTRATLGQGHVVERQTITPPPAAATDPAGTPELMEFDLADVPAEVRDQRRPAARVKKSNTHHAAKTKRSAKKDAAAKPIEPLVETEEEYQEPVYYRAAVNEGTLQVNSRPWARILVDGHFMGHTPQRALRLPVGLHRVLLVNDELDMNKVFEVVIQPGEVVTRVEMLDESAHSAR